MKIQYNRNRYYDYYTGRWLTQDPLGYVDGMNLYEYVKSNPITAKDPAGLSADLKTTAILSLFEFIWDDYYYDYFSITGMDKAYGKLHKALNWLKSSDYVPISPAADPYYSDVWNKLHLSPIPDNDEVFHEAVHVYNDMSHELFEWWLVTVAVGPGAAPIVGAPPYARYDEGVAYAATYMAQSIGMLKPVENELAKTSPARSSLESSWPNSWFFIKNSVIGAPGQYDFPLGPLVLTVPFTVNELDVSLVYRVLDFKIGCG